MLSSIWVDEEYRNRGIGLWALNKLKHSWEFTFREVRLPPNYFLPVPTDTD